MRIGRGELETVKVLTAADRQAALSVVAQVYAAEKGWLSDVAAEIPEEPGTVRGMSWFLTRVEGQPAGVIRLAYDPNLELPPHLDFQFERGVDLARLKQGSRFVEIGRFMILPEHRSRFAVALRLMKAAVREVAERGYTHFITDVFESDPHSPLQFHTRVLGFERIGSHRFGELACDSRRIILVLDIARAYLDLARRKDRVFREVTAGAQDLLEALAASGRAAAL
jgi:hypothetical protein